MGKTAVLAMVQKTIIDTVTEGHYWTVWLFTECCIRIRMSFIARYIYTYEEFVYVTEATAVQQNDSDGTKNTNNKNKN